MDGAKEESREGGREGTQKDGSCSCLMPTVRGSFRDTQLEVNANATRVSDVARQADSRQQEKNATQALIEDGLLDCSDIKRGTAVAVVERKPDLAVASGMLVDPFGLKIWAIGDGV